MSELDYNFVIESGIFPNVHEERKRVSYGGKDQLHKKISMNGIFFNSAFDSQSRGLKRCLELYKIATTLINIFVCKYENIENHTNFEHKAMNP